MTFSIKGSVGFRADNNRDDVSNTSEHLRRLGFSKYLLTDNIKLLQHIIYSPLTGVNGKITGRIEKDDYIAKWLAAKNCPKMIAIDFNKDDKHNKKYYTVSWIYSKLKLISNRYYKEYKRELIFYTKFNKDYKTKDYKNFNNVYIILYKYHSLEYKYLLKKLMIFGFLCHSEINYIKIYGIRRPITIEK